MRKKNLNYLEEMKYNINYTTIEQSKKLVELGLSPESADMWWTPLNWQLTEYYVEVKQDGISTPKNPLPCWSLGALLEVMPKIIFNKCDMYGWDLYQTAKNFRLAYIKYGNVNDPYYQEIVFHEINEKTLIGAVYSTVVWLLENGYIKTEKK